MSPLPRRARVIDSNEIRDIVFTTALLRLKAYVVYEGSTEVLDDEYQSLMFLGPPGVGKSALQRLAALDVARYLSEKRGVEIEVKKISMRISNDDALRVAGQVVEGRAIPYLHLYLPQTKIWHLEGTPSPVDNYVEVAGVRVPVNLWRLDPFFIPLLDYTTQVRDPKRVVPGFLVLDEFNMARKEILDALFQLARSAELGRAKLSPFTVISLVGNTPETNINAARQLASPLVDRAQNYVVSRPSVAGWLAYMSEVYGEKWAREVGAFLTLNPGLIYVQDESDPSVIQTPRGWTQVAVKIYLLRAMAGENEITRDQFWRHVERVVYSTLVDETADELMGFLRGLQYVDIEAVLRNPEEIERLDKSVAAYVMVRVAARFSREYVFERDQGRRSQMLAILARLVEHGRRVLGSEALSLVVSSLPAPMRLSLAKRLPPDVLAAASEARRVAEELEKVVS